MVKKKSTLYNTEYTMTENQVFYSAKKRIVSFIYIFNYHGDIQEFVVFTSSSFHLLQIILYLAEKADHETEILFYEI